MNNFNWNLLIGPLLGAVIGLITNGVAIRMLFRPLNPIKIGKHQLLFTPGLIPKEKPRIAKASGHVVASYLVNEDVLIRGLLNDEIDQQIRSFLKNIIQKNKTSEETLNTVILKVLDEDRADKILLKTKSSLTALLYQKAMQLELGQYIADAALKEIKSNAVFSAVSFFMTDDAMNGIHDRIVNTVETKIKDDGEDLIESMVDQEAQTLLDLPVSTLSTRLETKQDAILDVLIDAYHSLVVHNLTKVMQALNLEALVEEQINQFDNKQLEKIILSIMKKELNAIVYLGGLLGAIMGLIMNIV